MEPSKSKCPSVRIKEFINVFFESSEIVHCEAELICERLKIAHCVDELSWDFLLEILGAGDESNDLCTHLQVPSNACTMSPQ